MTYKASDSDLDEHLIWVQEIAHLADRALVVENDRSNEMKISALFLAPRLVDAIFMAHGMLHPRSAAGPVEIDGLEVKRVR